MKKRIVGFCLVALIMLFLGSYFIYLKKINLGSVIIHEKDDKPKNSEPFKESTLIKDDLSDKKTEIELKYDEYVVANGYIGASDNVYYTRNHILYHLIVSTNKTTKIAENVKKIESDKDTLLVYKDDNFKIINEDDYVTYID